MSLISLLVNVCDSTALSDFVSDEVVGKSVKLLKAYGLKVF